MTPTDIRARIERAKELSEKATAGPWEWARHENGHYYNLVTATGYAVHSDVRGPDAALIAESRTLLPALAADCEELLVRADTAEHQVPALSAVKRIVRLIEQRDKLLDRNANLQREAEHLRKELSRYEQAALPGSVAEIERAHQIAEQSPYLRSQRNPEEQDFFRPGFRVAHDNRATLLDAVRALTVERDALAAKLAVASAVVEEVREVQAETNSQLQERAAYDLIELELPPKEPVADKAVQR